MWHVAPESTSQQVLGSPTPTLPTKPSSVLLRWCVTGLSVLDVPVALFGPPASDPVFTAKDLTTIAAGFPPSCSTSGSWDSSASSGSSPSSTSRNFLLSLDLLLGPAVLSCMTWLAAMAAFHRLWAITSYVSSFAAVVASNALRALLWPVATCTLLSRSLVSLIRVCGMPPQTPNSGHCCCTTVKLHELCYLVWQVSQVEKVLIPLSDVQVSRFTITTGYGKFIASLSSCAGLSWTRHSHDANFSNQPLKPANSLALLFQDFQSGSGVAGIHFVSIVNLSDGPVEFCATVGVCCTGCWGSPGPVQKRRSITPWVSNICWRSICAITGSLLWQWGWPVKPESKNPGGIPKVAAEVPLCPLFPVCQVPVSALDWLPGKPAAWQNSRSSAWWKAKARSRPRGSVGIVAFLTSLTGCRWWFDSPLVRE